MNPRIIYVMTIVLMSATLMIGCGAPQAEPVEPAPDPTKMPTEAPVVEVDEEASATATPVAVSETAEETQISDEESGAPSESTSAEQWDEGPITFKSDSLHGNMTASGEPFDKDSFTAAHKDLPFDTEVTVINLFNGKSTIVRINDRLPTQVTAVIDISPAAAEAIEMVDSGIVDGRIEW